MQALPGSTVAADSVFDNEDRQALRRFNIAKRPFVNVEPADNTFVLVREKHTFRVYFFISERDAVSCAQSKLYRRRKRKLTLGRCTDHIINLFNVLVVGPS
jgi:hypothetical protein